VGEVGDRQAGVADQRGDVPREVAAAREALLQAVEERARALGYRRIVLETGSRQPEAVALYLAAGWLPLFDPAVPRPTDGAELRALPPEQRHYAFEKHLLGDPS
jgi:hypothetical protein